MIRTGMLTNTALAATLGALPALADVTAADVWASWQASVSGTGQTLEVESEEKTSDGLRLEGITMTLPVQRGSATTTLDEVVLREGSDGTVAVEASPEYRLRIEQPDPRGDGTMVMEMTITTEGMTTTASGDPDAISYDVDAPMMTFDVTSATLDGERMDMDVAVTVASLAGTYLVRAGEPQRISADFTAETVSGEVRNSDPATGQETSVSFSVADVAQTSTGTISPFSAGQNLSEMLARGLSTEQTTTFGAGAYEIQTMTPNGPTTGSLSTEGGEVDATLGEGGISYSGENRNVDVSVTTANPMMPPVKFSAATMGGALTFPLVPAETAQDFAMKLDFGGLVLDEALWSMADPAGALPRDPARLLIDLTGTGVLAADIADPETFTAPGGPLAIGRPESVDINAVELRIAGAALEGSGGFTFTAGELGPPRPSGNVDVKLTGGSTLVDRLAQIGAIPPDQAAQAKMMMGLFAQPGSEPDTMVTKIEVTGEGAIIVNGQRVR